VQVAVLVIMPNARQPHNLHGSRKGKSKSIASDYDWDEDELPDLVIGVADLPFRTESSSEPKLS